MSNETYTLYDIPTTAPVKCWSPNTWRARAILNIKQVPYTTQWIEYPDIKGLLQGFDLGPGPDDRMPYTLPLLRITPSDSKDIFIRESYDIVKYINEKYPNPPVYMDHPDKNALNDVKHKLWLPFSGIVITAVPDYLPERSEKYFHETREVRFGSTLAEYRRKCIQDDDAWGEMEGWIGDVVALLKKNGGPFFKGEKLSFLDIKLAGLLKWAENTGHAEDWRRIKMVGGDTIQTFLLAAGPWLKREDH